MMRLPYFRYHAPRRVGEAAKILAGEGPGAMLVAGGTDLLPNMKRRHQTPTTLVSLSRVDELRVVDDGAALGLGAGLTLTELVRNPAVRERYTGLWQAAAQIATPHLRNMGTLGGNICLDTRCTYYDQSYEWRKAVDYCLKKDGEVCWVAPSSSRCLAVSSTDTAPALLSLGARVQLVSTSGERTVEFSDLYENDGVDYIRRRPDEIVTRVLLEPLSGWESTYWKLRRRGAFDFPVFSVAAAAKLTKNGKVEDARIVLGAAASRPLLCGAASGCLRGKKLTNETIAEAAAIAARVAKPMDNTDFTLQWRKRVASEFVIYALRELRGDDMRDTRVRIARHDLAATVI
ncbi:MAG: FAD binding domain-containing protein [Candidatus Krumholzibacteriia bacterium]